MVDHIYEVIIIGAGVEGSCTGYYLTSRCTSNVLLLEQVSKGLHTLHELRKLVRVFLEPGCHSQLICRVYGSSNVWRPLSATVLL